MFRRKNTGGYVLKLSPQGPKMRFKSEKEANEYLAKLKEKNAKYRNNENNYHNLHAHYIHICDMPCIKKLPLPTRKWQFLVIKSS